MAANRKIESGTIHNPVRTERGATVGDRPPAAHPRRGRPRHARYGRNEAVPENSGPPFQVWDGLPK